MKRISVIFDLPEDNVGFANTMDAISHAIADRGAEVAVDLYRTDAIGPLGDGVVIGQGSPFRDPHAAEAVITRARVEGIPLVGT